MSHPVHAKPEDGEKPGHLTVACSVSLSASQHSRHVQSEKLAACSSSFADLVAAACAVEGAICATPLQHLGLEVAAVLDP